MYPAVTTTLDPQATGAPAPPGGRAVGRGAVRALPVASVVAVNPWGLAPHGPLRWLVVTSLVLLALAGLRGAVVVSRAMVRTWAALLLCTALATVTALDPLHAVIGTPDRRFGLLAWLGMAACTVIGGGISSPRDRVGLLRAGTVAGLLLAVGAGLDAVGLLPEDGVTGRIGGSYGQPAYLAAMAVLLIPLATALAVDPGQDRRWRVTAAVAAVGSAASLVATGTRGAWLGLGAAGALLIAGRWRVQATSAGDGDPESGNPESSNPGSTPRARNLAVTISAAVALVLVPAVLLTGAGPRAASGLDTSQGTAGGRLGEWAVATRVIADRPWLGTGPEGYRIAFPTAVDAAYGRAYGREVLPDRAHSSVLDVTATAGVVAGAAWLLLLAVVVLLGWRALRSDDPFRIGAGVAVIAYAAQQQLLFPLSEIDPVWWLLAGALVAAETKTTRPRTAAPGTKVWTVQVPLAVRLVALVLLGATVVGGGLGVVADRRTARAAELAVPPTLQAAADLADAATALRPDDIRLWFAAARIAQRGDRITDVDAALDRIGQALRRSPRDPALLAEHAALLLERARRSQLPADEQAAIAVHRDLLDADPANVGPRIGLATALAFAGQFDQARTVAAAAQALDPDAPDLPLLYALLGLLEDPADPLEPTGAANGVPADDTEQSPHERIDTDASGDDEPDDR
ncbi:hypothetical protein BH23ACT9_BH23ACT9_20980 [soil metagenome]